jgi:putative PIN family toxin of toxin-antitoxin system
MRIVLDTNVIISALIFGGLPRRILDLVTFGLCDFFYSPAIQGEVRRVLADKFGWEATQLDSRLPILFGWGTKVEPQVSLTIVEDDPDDNRILECAEASNADVIVSGDHHLLRLGSFRTIRIQSPREFLESEMWRSPIS